MDVDIELFGIPRRRVGQAIVTVSTDSASVRLSELIDSLVAQFPSLANDSTVVDNRYRDIIVCVDNHLFVRCPDDLIDPTQRVLLMSADVGG